MMWETFRDEVEGIRDAFQRHFKTKHPTFKQLAEKILGPDSVIGQVFVGQLKHSNGNEWTKQDYSIFMRTLLVQSAYRVSTRELFTKPSPMSTDELCPQEDYIEMWRTVASAYLPEDEKANRAMAPETLWMKVENAYNLTVSNLLMPSLLDRSKREILKSLVDDDKPVCEAHERNDNLNIAKHIRSNDESTGDPWSWRAPGCKIREGW